MEGVATNLPPAKRWGQRAWPPPPRWPCSVLPVAHPTACEGGQASKHPLLEFQLLALGQVFLAKGTCLLAKDSDSSSAQFKAGSIQPWSFRLYLPTWLLLSPLCLDYSKGIWITQQGAAKVWLLDTSDLVPKFLAPDNCDSFCQTATAVYDPSSRNKINIRASLLVRSHK